MTEKKPFNLMRILKRKTEISWDHIIKKVFSLLEKTRLKMR